MRGREIKLGAMCLFLVTIQDKISNSNFVFPEHCNISLNPITAFEKKQSTKEEAANAESIQIMREIAQVQAARIASRIAECSLGKVRTGQVAPKQPVRQPKQPEREPKQTVTDHQKYKQRR